MRVKKTTMANKARLIRDTLQLRDFDSEFMRRDLSGNSHRPMPSTTGAITRRSSLISPVAIND